MDFEILNFIQTHLRTPFLDDFFSRITHLGDAGTIWIMIAVILLFTKKLQKSGCRHAHCHAGHLHTGRSYHQTSRRPGETFYSPGYRTADPASGPVFFPVRSHGFFFLCRRILVFIQQKAGNPSFCPGSTDRVQQALSVCTFSNRCPRRNPTGHCLCSLCFPAVWTQWTRRWSSLKHDLS